MTDYGFYAAVYGGTLPEQTFIRLRGRASAHLDALTLGQSSRTDLPEAVRRQVSMALCAVADAMERAESGDVISESNDGISVTYAAKTAVSDEQRLHNAAEVYLAGTGLMYRGCL